MNRQNARKSAQMLAERLRKFEERTLGHARFSKASAFHTDMARDNHAHFGSANVTTSEQGATWQEA